MYFEAILYGKYLINNVSRVKSVKQKSASNFFIHYLADCQSKNIGEGKKIWQFCVVLEKVIIECNCNICANVFKENNFIIVDIQIVLITYHF